MLLAFTIGAIGNVIGATVAGSDLVWDVSAAEGLMVVLGNILGIAIGFALGICSAILRAPSSATSSTPSSPPPCSASSQPARTGSHDLQPWIDFHLTQTALFAGTLSAQQWANLGVTGVFWLVVPLLVGLRVVLRSEVK